ncbi:MAG: helicase-exonuclease AddAB subunit AddA [Bacillota bacterium]
MSPRWTDEQRQAIEHRGTNLLLSAAAGAGKTAVLVERVVRLVTDPARPVSLERLLVVTFTEAAAAEMKDRIRAALAERLVADPGDSWLRRQVALINRAPISTMHAFCLRLLRANFHRLGLDPAFRVLDEQEGELLRREVLDGLFEREYEAGGEDFTGLVDRYGGGRGDEGLRELVLRAYDFSRAVPMPESWLAQVAEAADPAPGVRLGELSWGRAALNEAALALDQAAGQLRAAGAVAAKRDGPAAYGEQLSRELAAVLDLARVVKSGDWNRASTAFGAFPGFESLPRTKAQGSAAVTLRDQAKEARDAAKDILAKLGIAYFGRTEDELLAGVRAVAPWVRALVCIVNAFAESYRLAKSGRAQLDFSDLEHLALGLLSGDGGGPSDLARELQARYDEVLVDEYQDINGVQRDLLGLVSRQWGAGSPNLFMVGDVKQSIYGFRLADPRIFQDTKERYERDPEGALPGAGQVINLLANFRSADPVIDGVNAVFHRIMTVRVGGLAYGKKDRLEGRADFANHPTPPAAVEVHLIERNGPDGGEDESAREGRAGSGGPQAAEDEDGSGDDEVAELEALEKEAIVVAERIRAMVGGRDDSGAEFSVRDRGPGNYRPVRFRDIVIILRATRDRANKLVEVLARYDIPAYAQLGTGYFEATEVETMLALLRVIDNPRQDIPLFAVLRSPIGGFSEDDLARVRLLDRRGEYLDALTRAASAASAAVSGPAAANPSPAVATVSDDLRQRCAEFLARLEEWRSWARRGGLADLVWRLYRETGYLDFVGGLPGGPQRRANLLALHGRAGQFDRFAVHGLSRFLRFADRLRETEGDLGPARAVGEDEDVVRIISAHGSKGLEFPVVFLADLGHRFNLKDLTADWLFHRELGLAPYFVDPEARLAYPTLAWRAVKGRRRLETLAEEMRLLYVAMTRARERLILVGSAKELPEACEAWAAGAEAGGVGHGGPLADHVLAGARCWLDWLGPAIISHPDSHELAALGSDGGGAREVAAAGTVAAAPSSSPTEWEPTEGSNCHWDVRLYGLAGAREVAATTPTARGGLPWADLAALSPLPPELDPAGDDAEIIRRLDWSYPDPSSSKLAAKVSASEARLSGPGRPAAGLDETALADEEEAAEIGSSFGRPGKLWRRPAFAAERDGGLTGAERGSAIHLVMQHLDLSAELDEEDLRRQLDGMIGALLLTEREAAGADLPALARFWRSELGLRLRAERERVRREVAFTLALPAREVTGAPVDDRVIIQGIIDCLLEEDDGDVVIDFKTDRVDAAEVAGMAEGYRAQVTLYRRAVEAIRGRPVRRTLLVFLHSGAVHEVTWPTC